MELSSKRGDNRESGRGFASGRSNEVRCRSVSTPNGRRMNKQELIDAVAAGTGVSKAATGEAIDAMLETITQALTSGDTVQLIGFGSFATGQRAARAGRNPSTGEAIQISAAKTVKFTAGKGFKDAVNA